ncbi:exopolysaccharide biosynthesis polyprenyl glycosylphosphotransferase [Nonomuraea sp. NPDC050328]|uniref:exopolysaccharide biosynthesis polyprenyl glycosylphosphotransferase n=1 Tax=Nonomuraea sp. NPDC050328 TaxID=3364361 RepID=UPI00379FF71C
MQHSPAPGPGRRPLSLRGPATALAGLGREALCLPAAAALAGWTVTNLVAAVVLAWGLRAVLGRRAAVAPVAGLVTFMLEAWWFAAAPPPPSVTWLAAGAAYAALGWLLTAVWQVAGRLVARCRAPRQAVVLSSGQHGARLAKALLQHPEYRVEPVGLIGDGLPGCEDDHDLPLLATFDTCVPMLRRSAVRTVIVAGRPPISRTLLQQISQTGCDVLFAPAPDDLAHDFVVPDRHLHSFPLVPMRPRAQQRPLWLVKRVMDSAIASLALLALSPVLLLCLLAARIEGGPGVLFRQRRVGMNGRPFDMLKIRTLKPCSPHDSATRWTVGENRISGPIAGFLRKTSLDELPQLWNVVIGQMSLVGPRPERPFFVEQFSRQVEHYDRRHRVPVGITGWAQVHGLRGDTSIEERARLDNYYIEAWSFGLDLRIALRTVGCVLRLGGA